MAGLFDTSQFMPHGHCYLWRPEILWLNVGADALIALSYFAIPISLVYFIRKREGTPFSWIFSLFAMFIILCGITHVVDIWNVWNSNYFTEGLVKLATGLVSATTAVALITLIPQALKLRTPEELELEVKRRTEELAETNARLEQALADRAASERALADSEARLVAITDAVPVMIVDVDGDLRYRFVNAAVTRQWQRKREEIIGRSMAEFLGPEVWEDIEPYALRALHGEELSFEATFERDGQTQHRLVNYVPHRNGEPGFYATVTDINETKAAQAAIVEAREAAEAANEAKSRFIANVSHEVRTPLAAVLGYSQLVQQRMSTDDENLPAIRTIQRNGEYLLEIINDVLDLSKIEAGKLDVEPDWVAVRTIVEDVIDGLRVRAEEKGLPIQVNFAEDVPAIVRIDALRAKQILVNLVGNAIKFTETGQIELNVARDGDFVSFEVVDTGIGMSQEEVDQLFRPFSQVDSSATRRFAGTGLGLSISNHLAELMGGQITVTSVKGKGSRFVARFHMGDLALAPEASELASNNEAVSTVSLEGVSALVVDDVPDILRLVEQILRDAGAQVDTARDGAEALRKVTADPKRYDLVVIDMQMPGMDGWEATRRLRQTDYRGSIIALTASAMKGDRERCLEAGCDDFLSKPVHPGTLLTKIDSTIPQRHGSRTPDEDAGPDDKDILVIDDSRDAADALAEVLRLIGYQVRIAETFDQARRAWKDRIPGVVLCDLTLPEGSGADLARELRAEGDADVTILALSGRDPAADEVDAFDGHLTKPVTLADLKAVLA